MTKKAEPVRVRVTSTIPPSVNHAYRRVWMGRGEKRYLADKLTDEAEGWMEETAWKAVQAARRGGWRCTTGEKVVVELRVFWPDARRRDIHNLHKLVADSLEGVVYTDDRYALLRDMDFGIDRARPRLELTWYRLPDGAVCSEDTRPA